LLLLLRKQPGITVADLAAELGISAMGVRRHITALDASGLVERSVNAKRGLGRPAAGWRLTAAGIELFPRRYDQFASELLDDVGDACGPEAVTAVLAARTEKELPRYRAALADADGLEERVRRLAELREAAGYLADAEPGDDGVSVVLVEHNCAVHRVAERFPEVCAQELALFQRALGSDIEVTRVTHTMSGDSCCAYCIRQR